MRTVWAAGAAIVVCLALGGGLAAAQEASPAASGPNEVTPEELFEVTLPPGVMSDQLERINTGGLTIAPGVEVVLGTDIEPIRGRVLYLESGGLVVTPMVDSPVWLGGAALGGSPDIAPAGEAVKLEPGDLIFLPVIAVGDLVPGATITIANLGVEPTVTRGFHAHAYESFPGWPEGITENEGVAEASDQDDLAAVVAGDVTFRSTLLTAPVGSSLPLDDAALFTLVDVYDGKVERTATGPDGTTPPYWNPIHGGVLTPSPGWTFDLTVAGDGPALVTELAVLPAGTALPAAPFRNGSFESGWTGGVAGYVTVGVGDAAPVGWEVSDDDVDWINGYWEAAAGARSIDLDGEQPGAISQDFETIAGEHYVVTFMLSGSPDGDPDIKTLDVTAPGFDQSFAFDTTRTSGLAMGWVKKVFMFTATGASSILAFTSTTSGDDHLYGAAIDDVNVTTGEDCKKRGWTTMTDGTSTPFKNQGDCVRFFATGGRDFASGTD